MKKAIFAIFAVLAVFAMVNLVSCGGGSNDPANVKPGTEDPDPGPGPGPGPIVIPEQANNTVRFLYTDGSYLDFDIEVGDTIWGDIISSKAYKRKGHDVWTDYTKIFSNWVDQNGDDWTDATKVIGVAKLTLTGKFYSNVVTDDGTALEKLQLENSGMAIYKFAIPADLTLDDFLRFEVTYKVTEFAVKKLQTKHRVYGEFSAFAKTKTTTDADVFNSSSVNGWQEDANGVKFINAPKFNVGGYIFVNTSSGNGRDFAFNNTNLTANLLGGDTEIKPDTWFTLKYDFRDPVYSGGAANNPLTATGTTLYYSFGQTSNSDNRNADSYIPNYDGPHAPILQLIKGVKLVHKTDATKNIIATIPNADEAQFMAYASPGEPTGMVWCWRGAASAAVVLPDELPPPPPPENQAINDYTYSFVGKTLEVGGDVKTSDDVTVITVSGNTITYDLTETNGGYNSSGKLGNPGGFKIKFEDLELPEIAGTKDFKSYESIIINLTCTDLEGPASNPNQVLIRKTVGDGAYGNNINGSNNNGNPTGYIGLKNGANSISIATKDVNFNATNTEKAIRVVPNNYNTTNMPWKGKITVNSITFVAY